MPSTAHARQQSRQLVPDVGRPFADAHSQSPERGTMPTRTPRVLRWLGYPLAFCALALVGQVFSEETSSVVMAWPSVGVAALWLRRASSPGAAVRDGVLVTLIAIVPTLVTARAEWPDTAIMAASTLAGAAGGAMVMRVAWRGRAERLDDLGDGLRLVLAAVATGAASMVLLIIFGAVSGTQEHSDYAGLVATRSGLSVLVIGMGVLSWQTWPRSARTASWYRALAVEGSVTVATYVVVFVAWASFPAAFLALPVTLWVASRADVFRSWVHLAIVTSLTIVLTVEGVGPAVRGPLREQLVLAQLYVAVVALKCLFVSIQRSQKLAAVHERAATADRLRQSLDGALIAQLTVSLESGRAVIGLVNPAAQSLLCRDLASLPGTDWLDLVSAEARDDAHAALLSIADRHVQEWRKEILHALDDGVRRWTLVVASALPDHSGVRTRDIGLQLLDITDRKEMEERLAHRAVHDDLTGLANRALLYERVGAALREATDGRVGLLFLDLDRFKNVNDSLGHAAGDELLSVLGDRLATGSRPGDTVARLGGDEFVICCPDISGRLELEQVARLMRERIASPITIAGRAVTVTVSIGATVSGDLSTPAQLVQEADAAMYEAKRRGGTEVEHFESHLRTRAARHLDLDQALRTALRTDQFVLHYQPVVDLADGAVLAAEALIRWNHPDRGLLAPGDWLDVAESSDLIIEIGAWAMHEACRQAARWAADGRALDVHVNVSGRQLVRPGIVELTSRALEDSGLDANRLVLELTETHLLEVHASMTADLEHLRTLGVRIAVDDFGTGYSSLHQLTQLPVDVLKIDRTFVAAMDSDPRATAVVHGIIGMARALHLDLVAEGIETTEQSTGLYRAGCTTGQGYLLGRPVPAKDLHLAARLVTA